MIDSFIEILHTDKTCPFCGNVPGNDYLTGINCKVCQPCRDTLSRWTPSFATLHTTDGTFDIWGYLAVAPTWDGIVPRAYFLDPQQPLSELDEDTKQTVLMYINEQHREQFGRAPTEDVKTGKLAKSMQKPIVETVEYVYAENVDGLPQKASEQSQATLADLG